MDAGAEEGQARGEVRARTILVNPFLVSPADTTFLRRWKEYLRVKPVVEACLKERGERRSMGDIVAMLEGEGGV